MNTVDVLIVDDDEISCSLLKGCIEPLGLTVNYYLDGKDALRSIQCTNPRMIILDIFLPEMDGFEFIHNMPADRPYIIAISSRPTYIQSIKKLGANEAYSKDNLNGVIEAVSSFFQFEAPIVHNKKTVTS